MKAISQEVNLKLAIGSDHAGYEMKSYLIAGLEKQGHDITDCGTGSYDSVDYPDLQARYVI